MVSSFELLLQKAALKKVKSHKNSLQDITHIEQSTITHEEEKAALILALTGGLTTWFMFR